MCFAGIHSVASLFPGDNTVSVTPSIGFAPNGAPVRMMHIDQETGVCTLDIGGNSVTARIVNQRRGNGEVFRTFEILTA